MRGTTSMQRKSTSGWCLRDPITRRSRLPAVSPNILTLWTRIMAARTRKADQKARKDVRLLGPSVARERAPTVSFVPHKITPAEVHLALGKRGIMSGAGHFYAVRLLEAMGIDPARGVVRLSFVHYTSPQEMTQLIEALDAILG